MKNRGISIFEEDGRRIVRGLGYYGPRTVEDLREVVKGSVRKFGDAVGFQFKDKKGGITAKTYREFDRDIDRLGTALMSLGLGGAHISILSENRYEWGVCYFSVVNGTGVVVPMDKYLPRNEVENLIERGHVEAIFYSPAFQDMMEEMARDNERIRYYICMEDLGEGTRKDGRFLSLPGLMEMGGALLEKGDRAFIEAPVDREKMSILLFTSGTTSISKGVMLSHANIASNVSAISTIIHAGPGDVHLSLLPLHHTFENTIGLSFMVHTGVCIAYCEGIRHVAQNIQEYKVTVLVAVPAILEAMYKKLLEGIQKSGREKSFRIMMRVSDLIRCLGLDLRRTLFKSVFEKMGPRLRLAVSGAAPIDPEVIKGFGRIGLKLIQGYGLTETSPVVAATNDFIQNPGTIGYPMAGIDVTIDQPDEAGMGEILTRGRNVMLGYYENEEATREAVDSKGWFRTGDVGSIDSKGFIRITGRAKSMIVLTNGKKAFPEEYEVLLNNIPGVRDAFVWGNAAPDGDIQVCAKVVMDKEKIIAAHGQIPSEEALGSTLDSLIREINKSIPQYKIIRYFVMTWEDLVKTTTLKIKRPVEEKKIREKLEGAGLDMRKASRRFLENL